MKSGKVWALWSFWPIVPHIGLQYWTYEEKIRAIDWQGVDMGAEQTKRYWRRNRKMFGRMQEAIEAQDPERVLVIVGSGHKYFLDELTREADYRWMNPREWLPESCAADEDLKVSERTTK